MRSALAWLSRRWHLALLALAVLLLAVFCLPVECLCRLNSDMVIPAIFEMDWFHGGHLRDWWWGGAPFVFPDLLLNLLFYRLSGNAVLGLQVVSAIFFVGWVIAVILVYRETGLPHVDLFAAFVVLLAVGILLPGLSYIGAEGALFSSVDHGGGWVVSLLELAWIQRLSRNGWRTPLPLAVLGVLTFLTCASDGLTVVILIAPTVAALLLTCLGDAGLRPRAAMLSAILIVPGVLGLRSSHWLFPVHSDPAGYMSLDLYKAYDSICSLGEDFQVHHNPVLPALVVIDGLAMIAGCWWAIGWLRSHRAATPVTFILLWSLALLGANWSSVILTGNYLGPDTNRYVTLSLLLPVVAGLAWLAAGIAWRPWAVRAWAIAAALGSAWLLLHPPTPRYYLTERDVLQPALRALMQKEKVHTALGDYWASNILTVISHGQCPVREITDDMQMSHWFVDSTWYTANPDGCFRLLLVDKIKPSMALAHFGPPERIEKLGPVKAWVYSPENAIHYFPAYHTLGNRISFPDENTYVIPATGMPHQTGELEGASLVGRPDRDRSAMLGDGPGFIVRPGRYRVEYDYAFLAPPDPDRAPIFDAVTVAHGRATVWNSEPLPYRGPGPQSATLDFVLPPGTPGQLQCRVAYRVSGILRIDGQRLTRLGD